MTSVDIALASTAGPGAWVRYARCKDAPKELFFPGRGDDLEPARAICAGCPVRQPCADYAIPISELRGVWGGMSEKQRRRARQRRQHTGVQRRDTAAANADADRQTPADPVAHQAPAGSLYNTIAQLAGHPDRWAIVARFAAPGSAAATASLLRTGKRPLPPGGRWQLEGRRNDTGGSDLWAWFAPDRLATAAGQ